MPISSERKRPSLVSLFATTFFAFAGCEGSSAIPLYPASGQVLVDSQPAAGVEVRLHPADRVNDLDAAVPFAKTDEDGRFRLGTKTQGDGAPAGRYRAALIWPDGPPGPSPRGDLLDGRYRDAASGTEVTIRAGDNTIPPFEVRKAQAPTRKRSASKKARLDTDAVGP